MCILCTCCILKEAIDTRRSRRRRQRLLFIYIYTYNVQDARTIIRVYNMYYNKRLLYTRHSTAPCIKCTHYITYITLPTEKKKKNYYFHYYHVPPALCYRLLQVLLPAETDARARALHIIYGSHIFTKCARRAYIGTCYVILYYIYVCSRANSRVTAYYPTGNILFCYFLRVFDLNVLVALKNNRDKIDIRIVFFFLLVFRSSNVNF